MKTETSIEELFGRFRATADHEALAAVFDRAAPRLLLVAAHVTPDPAAAEDLVQETFLTAMQKADQWNADRPLLPWLSGIMRHRAMDLARRLQRRRPTAPSELLEQAAAIGSDPSDAAAAEELLERVDQALASLTSPFREALVLRIVHGLEPTEIAHALGRPPATVRVQLKRGLERMRQTLPTSLAGALAALLAPGTGLAAARAAVLEAVGAKAATATIGSVPSAAGNTLKHGPTSRHLIMLVGGIATAALVWGLTIGFGAALAPPASTGSATPTARGPSDVDAALDSRGGSSVDVVRVAVVGSEQPASADAPSTIRGRIVSAITGEPVAGGSVTLSFGRGRFVTSDPTFRTYPEPLAFDVAADGRFAASWIPSPRMRVYLEAVAPGHTPVDTEWTSVRNGLDVDIGNVPVLPGIELRARCVDQNGAPVKGVEIHAERTSGGIDLPRSMFSTWIAYERTSGPDGNLAADMLPAPGTYEFSVTRGSGPWQVVAGKALELRTNSTGLHDIVLAPAALTGKPSLRGRVVDTGGGPVPAGLALQLHADMPSLGKALTESSGHFELVPEYGAADQELCLARAERRYRLVEPDRKYPLGDDSVLVRVERRPTFDVPVEVVDARTGQPVERFGLRFEHDYWADKKSFAIPPERFYWPAEPEQHDGGRQTLAQLPVGRYRLSVHPEADDLATSYMVGFEVEEGGAKPVRVELTPYATVDVTLRDTRGEPIADKKIRLAHLMANNSWSSLFSVEELRRGVGGGRRMAVGLQEVRTNAKGQCRLLAPVDEPRLVLVLGGRGALGDRHELGAVPAEGRTLEIELPATAVVHGRIGPPELLAGIGPSTEELTLHAIVRPEDSDLGLACPQLRLVGKNGERGGTTRLNADGSFRFDEALLGDWSLVIDLEWRRGSGAFTSHDVTLAQVTELEPGEDRELTIHAPHLMPATLAGRVLVDGAPWTRGTFGVLTSAPEDRDRFDASLTPNAAFDFVVRPDGYLPYVSWDEAGGPTRFLFATGRLTVRANQRVERSFSFEHRAVSIQVRKTDGTAASQQKLQLRPVDYPEIRTVMAGAAQADERGVLALDPAPPGGIEIRTPGGTVLGIVTAKPKAASQEVVLTLPR